MTPKSFTTNLILITALFAGHAFAQNNLHDFSPSAGGNQQLFVAVGPGEAFVGTTATAIARTVLTLSANTTNYIYVDLVGGTVTSNTSGFTSTSYPIAIAVTNNTSVSSLTDVRPGAFGASASTGTGTVTSVATTGPITGGTITTTGTIACASCVTSSSPGAGLAHFAGSTQAVTSSAVSLTADVTGILPAANGGTAVNNTASLTLGTSSVNLASLGTGIVKNTTTTGNLTNAAPVDIYGLFTNCTGSSGLFLKDGGTCAAAGGGLSGLTTGVVPSAASATSISNSSPQLDIGVTTVNTLTFAGPITATGAVTAGNPTGGVGSSFFLTQEGTPPTGLSTAAEDNCYSDSTQHGILCNFNAGTTLPLVQGPASNTTGHLATWSGTNGGKLVDGGAVPTGTVTSVATTGPLGGGTITTTGTLTCTTCVTSAASLATGGVVLGTAGTQASATNTQLVFGTSTLTVGLPGTGTGIVALGGATSGTATMTGPAVAGTLTNPIAFSNAISTGTAPTITTPGTGFYQFGTEGTEPASIAANTDGFVFDSTSHCPIQWNNAANVGCSAALGAIETFSAAQTFSAALSATSTTALGSTGQFAVSAAGLVTKSNNLTTAGQGFSTILGATSQKAETTTADANVLTVTPAAAAGTYRINVVISVSAATSGVIGWTATWTDSNGNAQTPAELELFQNATAAPALTFTTSAAGNYHGSAMIDVNNAGTAIVVKWIGGGTTTAKMSATVERVI